MENKISIDINGKGLTLPGDFSIDMEDVNPYFNDNESFSYEVPVSIEENREVFKDVDDVQSDKRLVNLENASMRLKVGGMPFRSGRLQTSEGEEVSDNVSIFMVSAIRTLSDLVADKNCQDIPVKDLIMIGEMIGNVLVECEFRYKLKIHLTGKGFLGWASWNLEEGGEPEKTSNKIELQALGYSFPGICSTEPGSDFEIALRRDGKPVVIGSFINVSDEYPAAKYCNARVCYTHYKKGEDGTSSDTVSTFDEFDPYYVLDADRAQSGICFYVLYFLECLFNSLNLSYDDADLLKIGDLKRLCFFTTHCKYDLVRKYPDKPTYDFANIDQINNWLKSRDTKAVLATDHNRVKSVESFTFNGKVYKIGDEINKQPIKSAEFEAEDVVFKVQANVMNMYANSRNFPDASVSSVLNSLWASFGIRFMVDYDKQTVKAVLIRDLFRNTEEPIVLKCDVLDTPVKLNEKITGVQMRYSAESDNVEKKYNMTTGAKDYDTNYDYIDYSNINTTLDYLEIIKKQSSSDKTCYIDLNTGNRYRIKVNADAENVSELKPAIFEVGAFTGVDLGDCSTENEDFIEKLTSDFEPIIPNDVNWKKEKAIGSGNTVKMYGIGDVPEDLKTIEIGSVNLSDRKQILAMYVDEDMWHENVTMTIQNAIGTDHADFFLNEVLNTDEAYDPTSSEDGNSPLQTIDWGLAIGVMRGGGADARIETYDWNYDGHGNSKWRTVAGEYAMSSDSMDNWGNQYDYNGVTPGIGDDERFSLKIRSFIEKDGQILCRDDERDSEGRIETKVRSRGLFDTFMSEYAHFLLNRKKIQIKFRCEVAELANIQWNRKYNIGGYIGWINKLKYTLSAEEGLGIVTAEIYQI